ncbi:MAG: hypothetical protein QOI04_65 [Verrucomicrobiota bacterium]
MINIDMMMRGEAQQHFTHALFCVLERMVRQITQRHRHVRAMRKLRRRDCRPLKRIDKGCDFGVARKLLGLQTGPAL